jgi:hypothetical protein
MTPSKFMWVVIAGRGHFSEELGRGFTGDLDEAKAKVNKHAEQRLGSIPNGRSNRAKRAAGPR